MEFDGGKYQKWKSQNISNNVENNLQVYSFFTIKVIVNLHDEIQKSTIASNRRESQDRERLGGQRGKDFEFFFAETQKSLITSCRRESQDSEEFGRVLGIDFEGGGDSCPGPNSTNCIIYPFPVDNIDNTKTSTHNIKPRQRCKKFYNAHVHCTMCHTIPWVWQLFSLAVHEICHHRT